MMEWVPHIPYLSFMRVMHAATTRHPPAIKVCLAAGEPAATCARVTTIKLRAAPSASKPGRCSGLAGRGDMGYNRSKIIFFGYPFFKINIVPGWG